MATRRHCDDPLPTIACRNFIRLFSSTKSCAVVLWGGAFCLVIMSTAAYDSIRLSLVFGVSIAHILPLSLSVLLVLNCNSLQVTAANYTVARNTYHLPLIYDAINFIIIYCRSYNCIYMPFYVYVQGLQDIIRSGSRGEKSGPKLKQRLKIIDQSEQQLIAKILQR